MVSSDLKKIDLNVIDAGASGGTSSLPWVLLLSPACYFHSFVRFLRLPAILTSSQVIVSGGGGASWNGLGLGLDFFSASASIDYTDGVR